MAIITGHLLGSELCRIFGLEDLMVRGIELRSYAGETAMLTVELYIPKDKVGEVCESLRKYKLVMIDDERSDSEES